jgi:hypothetical protein
VSRELQANRFFAKRREGNQAPSTAEQDVQAHHHYEAEDEGESGEVFAAGAVGLGDDLAGDHEQHGAGGAGKAPRQDGLAETHRGGADESADRLDQAGEQSDQEGSRSLSISSLSQAQRTQ